MEVAIVQAPPLCSDHPRERVTMHCQWCRRPLCLRCSHEQDAGGALLCGPCVLRDIGQSVEARRAGGRQALARIARRPLLWRRARLVAGLLVVAAQLGWLAEDPAALWGAVAPAPAAAWTVGAAAPAASEGEECARRLLAARLALDRVRVGSGQSAPPPAALPAPTAKDRGPFACPASDRPFAYQATGRDGAVACPNPDRHGVRALVAAHAERPPHIEPR